MLFALLECEAEGPAETLRKLGVSVIKMRDLLLLKLNRHVTVVVGWVARMLLRLIRLL